MLAKPIGLPVPAHQVLEILVGTDHVALRGFDRPRNRLLPKWMPEARLNEAGSDAGAVARERKRLGRYLMTANILGIVLIAAGSAAAGFAVAQPGAGSAAGRTSTINSSAGSSPSTPLPEPQKPALEPTP
jgi:hypothetical protein